MFENLSGSGSFGPNGPSLSRSTSGITKESKSNYFDDNPLDLSSSAHQHYHKSTDIKHSTERQSPNVLFPTRFPNSPGTSKFQQSLSRSGSVPFDNVEDLGNVYFFFSVQ